MVNDLLTVDIGTEKYKLHCQGCDSLKRQEIVSVLGWELCRKCSRKLLKKLRKKLDKR